MKLKTKPENKEQIKELPYTTIKEMEQYIIKKALAKAKNKEAAAKMLGITTRTLYTKIYNYNL